MKTIKNLITFSALAFVLVGIQSAQAYVPGVWDPQPRVNNNEPGFYVVPQPQDPPVVMQTSTTTVVQNHNTYVPYNNTNSTTTRKNTTYVAKNRPISNTNDITTPAQVRDMQPTQPVYSDNGIAALSIAGSGGFMPSSIWQWILAILLILAIIIIARMLGRSHQEVHTVTAH